MGKIKYTEEQIDNWKVMRAQGMNLTDISRKTGISREAIYRLIGSDGKTFPNRKPPVKITDNMVEDMNVYQDLGLSNSQIAIEMGLSKTTVQRYLGRQKKARRAEYGSLISHATGDSFVPEGYDLHKLKEEKKLEHVKETPKVVAQKTGQLKVSSFSLVLSGKINTYTITNGCIMMEGRGSEYEIRMDELDDIIQELQGLKEVAKSSLFSIELA